MSLTKYAVVVTKSTVPVGTSRKVEEIIRKTRPKAEFDMASNPEFLREGSAIGDFRRPDRVVVGCDTERARESSHAYLPVSGAGHSPTVPPAERGIRMPRGIEGAVTVERRVHGTEVGEQRRHHKPLRTPA